MKLEPKQSLTMGRIKVEAAVKTAEEATKFANQAAGAMFLLRTFGVFVIDQGPEALGHCAEYLEAASSRLIEAAEDLERVRQHLLNQQARVTASIQKGLTNETANSGQTNPMKGV